MTRIQWVARATAGRPYSGHRGYQGCSFDPGINRSSTHRANTRFAHNNKTMPSAKKKSAFLPDLTRSLFVVSRRDFHL